MPASTDSSSKILAEFCSKKLPRHDQDFLDKMQEHFQKKLKRQIQEQQIDDQAQSFSGMRLLLNQHVDEIVLWLVNACLSCGMDVDVMSIPPLCPREEALAALREAQEENEKKRREHPEKNLPSLRYIPGDTPPAACDAFVDCGGVLRSKVTPTIGGIEQTHTDKSLYKDVSYPVINIDASQSKLVEITHGTARSAVNVLKHVLETDLSFSEEALGYARGHSPRILQEYWRLKREEEVRVSSTGALPKSHIDLFFSAAEGVVVEGEPSVTVFGCGKVGGAIVGLLSREVIPKDKIRIVDADPLKVKQAKDDGYQAVCLSEFGSADEIQSEKTKIMKSSCWVITATGRKGVLTECFDQQEAAALSQQALLMNMGTEDEFGEHFKGSVLNKGGPANFLRKNGTDPECLTPVYVSMYATIASFKVMTGLRPGLNPLPEDMDREIIDAWKKHYHAANHVADNVAGKKAPAFSSCASSFLFGKRSDQESRVTRPQLRRAISL